MPVWAFAAMVAGGLWICIWQHPARRYGILVVLIGAAAAALTPRPDLLVTGDGRHLAVVASDGRPALLRARTGDYVRDTLSEAAGFDGDAGLLDEQKFGRCSRDSCIAVIDRDGRRWQVLATRSRHFLDWRSFVRACAASDIVVSDRRMPDGCAPRWLKLDRPALAASGGLAIMLDNRPRVSSVAERIGDHPWRWRESPTKAPLSSGGSAQRDGPGSEPGRAKSAAARTGGWPGRAESYSPRAGRS